jgi:hypothetical protein
VLRAAFTAVPKYYEYKLHRELIKSRVNYTEISSIICYKLKDY